MTSPLREFLFDLRVQNAQARIHLCNGLFDLADLSCLEVEIGEQRLFNVP